jgi:hypothetical protein
MNRGREFENARGSPSCGGNFREFGRKMEGIPKDKMKMREFPYKTAQDLLKIAGLKPTPDRFYVIQNIFNDNRIQFPPHGGTLGTAYQRL